MQAASGTQLSLFLCSEMGSERLEVVTRILHTELHLSA